MTQQQTPTCTVVLRAETGPCEACGSESRISVQHRGVVHPPNERYNHPYLGPSLGVCGHEEDEHSEFWPDPDAPPVPCCDSCWTDEWFKALEHAFTTTEEPVNV